MIPRRCIQVAVCVGTISLCVASFRLDAATYSSAQEARAALKEAQARYAKAREEQRTRRDELQAAKSRVNQITATKGRAVASKNAALGNRIFDLKIRLQAILAKRDAKLAELREGFWCSKCNRSKSEIEASGEDFWEHLAKVCSPNPPSDCLVKATPEQLEAASNEFDGEIKEVQEQIGQLENEQKQNKADYKREVEEAQAPVKDLEAALARTGSEVNNAASRVTAMANALRLQEQKDAIIQLAQAEATRLANEQAEREKASTFFIGGLQSAAGEKAASTVAASGTTDDVDGAATGQISAGNPPQPTTFATEGPPASTVGRSEQAQTSPPTAVKDTPDTADAVVSTIARIDQSERGTRQSFPQSAANLLARAVSNNTTPLDEATTRIINLAKPLLRLTETETEAAKQGLKQEFVDVAMQQMREALNRTRPDLEGIPLDPGDVLNRPQQGPSDAADTVLGGLVERTAQVISEYSIKEASSRVVEKVEDRAISRFNSSLYGIEDKSKSDDPFERAQDAFYKKVSPANLVTKIMESGGNLYRGVYRYMDEVYDRFFKFLDLAPGGIERAMDEQLQSDPSQSH